MSRITQSQIARDLGVSRQAVGFALGNYKPCSIKLSPETRQRILEAARQKGYVPNLGARRMARTRTNSKSTSFDQIGMIYIASPKNPDGYVSPVFLSMMQGAEHELSNLHSSLTFVRIKEDRDWEKVARLTQAGSIDGWLLYGAVNDEIINQIKPTQLPYVILGDYRCTQPVHCVNTDYASAGRMAVQYLNSHGHRHIGYVGGALNYWYQQQTFKGFQSASNKMGLKIDKRSTLHSVNLDIQEIKDWLSQIDRLPTAMFVSEAGNSGEVVRALHELKIKIPQQMALISCEFDSTNIKGPNLTQIVLPFIEVGSQGAILLHKVVTQTKDISADIRVTPSLVEGWSTGEAPITN